MKDLCKERQKRNKISFSNKKEPTPSQKSDIPDTSVGVGYAKNKSTAPKRRGTFEG